MKRRSFLKQLKLAMLAGGLPGNLKAMRNAKQPNVIILQADQMVTWALGVYQDLGGQGLPDGFSTPNIDSIGLNGAIANNYFCTVPECSPSRATFVTGQFPDTTKIYRNTSRLPEDSETIGHIFKNVGYSTAYFGTWHLSGLGPVSIPGQLSMGFDYFRYMYDKGEWKKMVEVASSLFFSKEIGDENSYTTDFLLDRLMNFMEKKRRNPYMAFVALRDPHAPMVVRKPYDTMFPADKVTLPETYLRPVNSPDWLYNPEPIWATKGEQKLRERKSGYLGMIKLLDDKIGQVLEKIRALGDEENTIVIFTSDHGEFMGEHRRIEKFEPYNAAVRIPFLIKWPGTIPAGTIIDQHMATVDFKQTISSLLKIPTNGKEEGVDFSRELMGKNTGASDRVMLEFGLQWIATYNQDYMLTISNDSNKEHVMYSKNDPKQIDNIFGSEEHKIAQRSLEEELMLEHMNRDSRFFKRYDQAGMLRKYKFRDISQCELGKQLIGNEYSLTDTKKDSFKIRNKTQNTFKIEKTEFIGGNAGSFTVTQSSDEITPNSLVEFDVSYTGLLEPGVYKTLLRVVYDDGTWDTVKVRFKLA